MEKCIKLFLVVLTFSLLLGCASRGWQLSEQIQGYNNKLKPVTSYVNAQSGTEKRNPSSQNIQDHFIKGQMIQNGRLVRTTFGEPGLLLDRKYLFTK